MLCQVSQPNCSVGKETVLENLLNQQAIDFDRSEALTDPDSASAKYLAKQESYLEAMSDYVASSNEQVMQTMTKATRTRSNS